MRALQRYQSPSVRAHIWRMAGSIAALLIGSVSCGSSGATDEPQDESTGAGGSAGSDGASGSPANGGSSETGGNSAAGGEQASDGGRPTATGGNGSTADSGRGGQAGSVGAGGSSDAASSVPSCGTIVYDGEGPKTNLASGATFVWPTAGGSLSEVTGEAHSGLHSMKVTFTPQGGWAWNWGHWVDKTRGVDASQATQLSFWLKASAAHIASGIVTVDDNSSIQSNRIDLAKHLPGGLTTTWQKVSIPMSEFTGINKQHLWEIYVEVGSGAAVELYFDDAVFESPCPQ